MEDFTFVQGTKSYFIFRKIKDGGLFLRSKEMSVVVWECVKFHENCSNKSQILCKNGQISYFARKLQPTFRWSCGHPIIISRLLLEIPNMCVLAALLDFVTDLCEIHKRFWSHSYFLMVSTGKGRRPALPYLEQHPPVAWGWSHLSKFDISCLYNVTLDHLVMTLMKTLKHIKKYCLSDNKRTKKRLWILIDTMNFIALDFDEFLSMFAQRCRVLLRVLHSSLFCSWQNSLVWTEMSEVFPDICCGHSSSLGVEYCNHHTFQVFTRSSPSHWYFSSFSCSFYLRLPSLGGRQPSAVKEPFWRISPELIYLFFKA